MYKIKNNNFTLCVQDNSCRRTKRPIIKLRKEYHMLVFLFIQLDIIELNNFLQKVIQIPQAGLFAFWWFFLEMNRKPH